MKTAKYQGGFTLIEFLIAMGMFAIISALVGNTLLTSNNHASLYTTVSTFIANMRQQQLKAMIGDTLGAGTQSNYGIYFQPTSYTLFTGSTYSSSNSANILVNLPTNIKFTNILFPSSQVVFFAGSGEVQSYASTSASVALEDSNDSNMQTISVNRYGVVSGIN